MTTTAATTGAGWQLQGTAADAYEAYLVPAIFTDLAAALVDRADLREGERVLDVGCGTGVVARAAARAVGPGGSVTGVDLNPTMLARARQTARGTRPTITFHQGEAESLPMEDDAVDAVLCQQVLQFLPDRVVALREMGRVAAPDTGRVAVGVLRSLDQHPVYAILVDALDRHAGAEAAAMMASPFGLGDGELLRREAQEAGLRDVSVHLSIGRERFPSVADMVRQEAASSPLAGALATLDDHRWEALVADLEGALAPWCDDAGITFHNETHLVVGRA